jgi:ribosomal-protein-alanine N-acetyltransferase
MDSAGSKGLAKRMVVEGSLKAPVELCPIELDAAWVQQVTELENICFESPWGEDLVISELASDRSLAMGILAGGCELIAYSLNRIVADELHVLRIGVEKKFRKQGIAHTLMGYVLNAAKEKGAQLGLLECRASNQSAERLYRGLGFHIEGSRRGYYRDNGEDALLFSLNMTDTKAKTLAVLKHRAV